MAVTAGEFDAAVEKTTEYVLSAMPQPGEDAHWLVMALVQSGAVLPEGYLADYHAAVEEHVAAVEGVLDERKNTEYSRAILGLTAAGFDAASVGGYDLTAPLGDFEATKRQGLNGPIFALLALDSGDYSCPIRQDYVDYILSRQLTDGGWAISGQVSDTDLTAMALRALVPYREQQVVSDAMEKAVERLSRLQRTDGSYGSYGVVNCESAAQAILALCALDIPLEDHRFVKGGRTALDAMLDCRLSDGSFSHLPGGQSSGIAAEQAFLALAALREKWEAVGLKPPAPPAPQPAEEDPVEEVQRPRLAPPVPVSGEGKGTAFAIFARYYEDLT